MRGRSSGAHVGLCRSKQRNNSNKQATAALSCKKGEYVLVPTKNDKGRIITLAPYVIDVLKQVRLEQLENKLRYGEAWVNSGFVFTNPLGEHLKHNTVYKNFKKSSPT